MPTVNVGVGALVLTGVSITIPQPVTVNVGVGSLILTGVTVTPTASPPFAAGCHVFVDWNGDGDFSDSGENISADVQSAEWTLGIRQAYQVVADEATCRLTLKNTTGKYNPENTSSPFYPNLKPHVKMRIYLSNGTTQYLMWAGFIDSIDPEWMPQGAATGNTSCVIRGKGIKQQLENVSFHSHLYTDFTADEVVDDALQQVVLPPDDSGIMGMLLGIAGRSELGTTTILGSSSQYSTVDTGLTTFARFGDSADYTCYSVIRAVTEAERGRFFQDRYGKAVWWNRHHLLLIADVTATVSDTAGSTYTPKKVDYSYGDMIANVVRVTATPREETAGVTLWQLNSALTIGAQKTIEFEAEYNDAFLNPTGGGTDVSLENESYSTGTATAEIYANRGTRAIIRVRNTADVPAVLDTLSIVGTAISTTNTQTAEMTDADSILAYGKKEISFSLKALDTYAQAETIARFELNRRKDPRGMIKSLTWIKNTGTIYSQITWTMGTRLTVQLANGHDADHFVIGESHNWRPGTNGGIHTNTLFLEPASSNNFWVLGKAGASEAGVTTVLAY